MTQGIGKRLGAHFVNLGALETTTGRFSPVYQIYRGEMGAGTLVHEQQFPWPGEDFERENDAFHAGLKAASDWLDANPPAAWAG